ncbi:Gfo/Idh/MocA family protein [Deinococcus maricopensis]|uniref:Glucose-fructose oxidoreductase n=1 Tax=Deinococcus maricopensis (strain DSM 21211 / LMG 22137 / NRRL B-23946 / LB-34) TaxID=709986 RepID=E8U353_DEIML|nr:Gfo/Idh/MocA family oxidoreductase [Deinococcus maricopensis]ADV65998.1 Glucose-fructose oxidoreductase [Deinococcus maricopensis DSM 21211]
MTDHQPLHPQDTAFNEDRRQLLRLAGGALMLSAAGHAVAAQLAPTEKPSTPPEQRQPEPPGKRLGWAVVGLGEFALGQVLPALREAKYSRLTALVSGDPAKARRVADQHGVDPKNIYSYDNFDSIRDNPDIDVVYIVLPNGLHAEYSVRASRAGKHVMTEKPMATSPEECEQMIQAARAANRKLMVAYRAQFEPRHVEVARLTRTRAFGNPRAITAEFVQNQGDPAQWRLDRNLAGGGSLPDIGLYPLNFSRFVLGEEPSAVMAHISSPPNDPRFREVEDRVAFTLHFPSGVIAHCLSGYSAHRSSRFRIMSERGWASLDPAFAYERNRLTVGRRVGQQEGIEERQVEDKSQFVLEIDHLSQAILENKPVKTPGEEGLRDHVLMRAIYRSAEEGRRITLS